MTEIYKKNTIEITSIPNIDKFFFIRETTCNYCVYYIVDGMDVNPAWGNYNSIPVEIQSTDTTEEIAQKISDTLAATNQFETEISGNLVIVTCLREGDCDGVVDHNTGFIMTDIT